MMTRDELNQPDQYDPTDEIRDRYGMDDYEMMLLFGTDSETQRALLREHPEWRGAVRDMEGLFGL